MHPLIDRRLAEIALLCDRHGVRRLEVFDSAARGTDFDPARSDVDFLVAFGPAGRDDPAALLDFGETLLDRPVDLVEREAVEASRNHPRRRRILAEAETMYG